LVTLLVADCVSNPAYIPGRLVSVDVTMLVAMVTTLTRTWQASFPLTMPGVAMVTALAFGYGPDQAWHRLVSVDRYTIGDDPDQHGTGFVSVDCYTISDNPDQFS